MVGQPGSLFFTRRGLSIATLHSSINCTTSVVGSDVLFPRISLIYLAYVGTCIASRSGMLTYSLFITSTNMPNFCRPPASLSVPKMVRQLYHGNPVKFYGVPWGLPGLQLCWSRQPPAVLLLQHWHGWRIRLSTGFLHPAGKVALVWTYHHA